MIKMSSYKDDLIGLTRKHTDYVWLFSSRHSLFRQLVLRTANLRKTFNKRGYPGQIIPRI